MCFKSLPINTLCFVGIRGNASKSTVNLPRVKVGVPYTDFKPLYQILTNIFFPLGKLYSVKPVLGDWQSSYRWCKKDEMASVIII